MTGRTRALAVLVLTLSAVALAGALLGASGPAAAAPAVGAGEAAIAKQEGTTTVAPAPSTGSSTTVADPGRRITQDTPALGGVIAVWLLGIAGVVAILGAGWWRTREP